MEYANLHIEIKNKKLKSQCYNIKVLNAKNTQITQISHHRVERQRITVKPKFNHSFEAACHVREGNFCELNIDSPAIPTLNID